MLEERYKNNPAYQDYIRSTNALVPNIRTFAADLVAQYWSLLARRKN